MDYTLRLMLNSAPRYWRSRHGFMSMIALFRIGCIFALMVRFWSQRNTNNLISFWFILLYFLFSLIIFLVVYLHPKYTRIDKPIFYSLVILIDTIVIEGFLFLTSDYRSEIYLLLLLPLVLTSHYFSRRNGVLISAVIVLSYGATLVLMRNITSFEELVSANILLFWLKRVFFLLGITWVYRVQSNFPRINETRIFSPEKARHELEEKLANFKKSIHYDTISVQILYRDRLQIVACEGFPNKKEIYQIEFPANNPQYPNYLVLRSLKPQILDPNEFPSFKEPRYHAGHIHSWLGIPLISPSTGECFGLLSVDSAKHNSYNRWDAIRASWFALRVSAYLIGVALGPAALTQATKREDLLTMLKDWAELFHPKKMADWQDDLQAANELVQFGTKIFNVEDCSIYFLRHRFEDGDKIRVLHLVASSAIPSEIFSQNESKVTGHHGDGLTGLAVHRNRTINYGAKEIKNSPYRSKFIAHLPYLFSKCSRQIMVVPLRDSRGKTTGAIKLENRLGWPSENLFFPVEQHSFEIFAAMVSLLLENIRLRNFANRQSQTIHNMRSIVHTYAYNPIDNLILEAEAINKHSLDHGLNILRNVRNTVSYTKIGLDNLLTESAENLLLEKEGLIPMIYEFVASLKTMMLLNDAANLIKFKVQGVRDDLPVRIRVGFYNIARESVLNMARHSKIENKKDGYCLISFYKVDETYHLCIEDNGIGFVPQQKLEQSHSFGLRDMYFQKEAIGKQCAKADIHIQSKPDEGTIIHVWALLAKD